MSGFLVDDAPKEDTIPFGGVMVKAHIDSSGLFSIQYPNQLQALLNVRQHIEQVRRLGINETPPPVPAVETATPVPTGHIAGPPPASTKPPAPAPVEGVTKRPRGRPRKNPPATD